MTTAKNTTPTLLAIATATRFRAQRLIEINLWFQWVATSFSCFAFFYNEKLAWFMVSIAFCCKITSFIINYFGLHYHSVSREAQRLALLEDSFGKMIDNFQVVELRRKINPAVEWKAKQIPYPQPYYTGNAKKGNLRLKENIQQSTFWSKSLIEYYSSRILLRFFVSLIIVTALTFTILVWVNKSRGEIKIFNPYLLTLGSLTFLLGLVDYFNVWLSCKGSVKLLSEVDQRLEKVNIDQLDILLANFADYSIAMTTAPPIPFNVYSRNKERLKELWDQRVSEIAQQRNEPTVVSRSLKPAVILLENQIPLWTNKEVFSDLLFSVAGELSSRAGNKLLNKIKVFKIESFSGVPVFDIQLFSEDIIFRHLILRLHRDAEKARSELNIIKKISDESVDLISYTPLEEPFISRGALFYYHADIQTHDQLLHIHEYVALFFQNESTDFESYFNKMLSGFKTIAIVYEKLSGSYSPKPLSDSLAIIKQSLPPTYILDLRQKISFLFKEQCITILKDNKAPDNKDTIISAPFNPESNDWFSSEFIIHSVENFISEVVEITIDLAGSQCKILIDSTIYTEIKREDNRISLLFIPKHSLQQIKDFYTNECGLILDDFQPIKSIADLTASHPRQGLLFAFRHRDLHCKNCLTSRSNFKIIDVADSNLAMICSDIARIEISLISSLITGCGFDSDAIEQMLKSIDACYSEYTVSDRSLKAAKLIKAIRDAFYLNFNVAPSELDITLGYYLEICQQLTYSISSPIKLSKGFEPVIQYWNQKLNTHK